MQNLVIVPLLLHILSSAHYAAKDQKAIEIQRKENSSIIIHIATLNEGVSRCSQIETLIKSILLYHRGIIHMHIFADERSREMMSVMFQTWPLDRVRWSLYEMETVHEGGRWLPSKHHSGTIGVFKFVTDDVMPLFVEKLIVIDSDTLLLDDIQFLHDYFFLMEKQGAFWATTEDQYPRGTDREIYPHKDRYGENNGVLLLDLKMMREIGDWNKIWKNETFSLYQKVGPLLASDQDVYTSLAYWFPTWHYRLPCVYNFQMGEYSLETQCVGEWRDFSVIKIAHWTEGIKWDGVKTNPKFFTQIYRCVQRMDGNIFGVSRILLNLQKSETRRTLHYIKDVAEAPALSDITLAAHVPFNRSYDQIDRMNRWPGPASLVVFGNDEEKMLLNNYLHKNVNDTSDRLAIHFVHPAIGELEYPSTYLAKISVDASRTERVLAANELEKLDLSRSLYSKFWKRITQDENNSIAIIRSRKGSEVIGAVMRKRLAQLINAKDLTAEEAVDQLRLKASYSISEEPIPYMNSLFDSTVSYPSEHYCQVQISQRNPIITGWNKK
ncbi:hypothetical protein PENTCL1PPCAC_16713, partial [Pristionchus entomophagus]